MVCRDFILPEPASYVFFYALFNLRKLLYIIALSPYRLLREFYPKCRNLFRVAPATLKRNLAFINARPRKVLGFLSPQSLWELELLNCCT